jgi:asparagine synthase (glutamine-hydrolysing)
VDSSTVVAIMAQVTDQPIKTFSIGSPADDYNELPYARLVAKRFGTDHHEFVVEPDALAVLPELLRAYDEPFADVSAIPTYYVSRLARQHVTVALAGDGGDELFAGYPWYRLLREEDWITRLPRSLRRAIFGQLYRAWPDGWRGKARLNLWKQPNPAWRYAVTRNRFPPYERQRLLTPALQEALAEVPACDMVACAAGEAQALDRVSMMQYADLMTYLPEQLLVKVDRASMWHSLEVRAPLLDHKLVEFVLTIPAELKLSNGDTKHILKCIVSAWVPREALYRRKMGFGIPLEHWFRGELFDFACEILLDRPARQRGYFRSEYISDLLERHRAGQSDPTVTTHQIWNLLYLELWCREFLDKAPAGPPVRRVVHEAAR